MMAAGYLERKTSENETLYTVSENEPVKVRLKWFNAPKGFGFVVPEGENADAFLHVTVLQHASIQVLGEGAVLLCQIDRGPKGNHVTNILEIIDEGALSASILPLREKLRPHDEEIMDMTGAVKWYKIDKGFGFIIPDDGYKDIFIHKSCLEKHGINTLIPGQRLSMTIRCVPKGREVIDFKLPEK